MVKTAIRWMKKWFSRDVDAPQTEPTQLETGGPYRTVGPSKKKPATDQTFCIDFTPDAWRKLMRLCEIDQSENAANTIIRALRFYEWAMQRRAEGWNLATIDKDGVMRELVISFSQKRDRK